MRASSEPRKGRAGIRADPAEAHSAPHPAPVGYCDSPRPQQWPVFRSAQEWDFHMQQIHTNLQLRIRAG